MKPTYKNLEDLAKTDIISTLKCDADLSTPHTILRYHVTHGTAIPTLTQAELSLLLDTILPSMIKQESYSITYTSLTTTEKTINPANSIVLRNLIKKGILIKENKITFRLNFNNIIPQKHLKNFKDAFYKITEDTGIEPTKKGAILQNEHKVQVTDRLLYLLAQEEDTDWKLRKQDKQIIHYLLNKMDMENIIHINLTDLRAGYITKTHPYLDKDTELEVLKPYTLSVLNKALIRLRDLEVFQVISNHPVDKFKKDVHYKLFINPRMMMRAPNRWAAFAFVSELIFEAQRLGDNSVQEGMFEVLLEKATKTVRRLRAERNKARYEYTKDKKVLNARLKEDETGVNPLTKEEFKSLQPIYEGFEATIKRIM